jgi:hypothetical protein
MDGVYIHFDALPVGARFVGIFTLPVWTKIEPDGNVDDPFVATTGDDQLKYSQIMQRLDGYVGIITEEI